MFARDNGYDSQACVEEALRRAPDPSLIPAAATEFELGCKGNDAGACSALGVLYELGIGRAKSYAGAHKSYERACKAGNQRGCVNLGRLESERSQATNLDRSRARILFATACEANEASGCAELGRMLARDKSPNRDLVGADIMLGRACEKNLFRACYELAELYRGQPAEDVARSTTLYAKACLSGYQPACMRLDPTGKRIAAR